jgi:hypothetical protein
MDMRITDLFLMHAATYKEMWDSLQPSSIESKEEEVSQAEQSNRRKISAAPRH